MRQPDEPSSVDPPFSESVNQLLAAARQRELGVEHLIVGLMQERLNVGAQALAQHGVTLERALEHARQAGA
jgi:hypothetical protein